MIGKGWEKAGGRIIGRKRWVEAVAVGVYARLCVSRSIESASAPQQLCDPSVMLLIVTLAGLRASARARQAGGWGVVGGRHRLCELERENREEGTGETGEKRRGEQCRQKCRRRDGWDCSLSGIVHKDGQVGFFVPPVLLCPAVPLDAK